MGFSDSSNFFFFFAPALFQQFKASLRQSADRLIAEKKSPRRSRGPFRIGGESGI
jgi:hypothetical protein